MAGWDSRFARRICYWLATTLSFMMLFNIYLRCVRTRAHSNPAVHLKLDTIWINPVRTIKIAKSVLTLFSIFAQLLNTRKMHYSQATAQTDIFPAKCVHVAITSCAALLMACFCGLWMCFCGLWMNSKLIKDKADWHWENIYAWKGSIHSGLVAQLVIHLW